MTTWFWLMGIVVLSLLPPLIKTLIGGNEDTVTAYLALFSVAVGLGSGLAARIAHGRIVLTTTLIGAVLLAAFALDLGVTTWSAVPAATPQAPAAVFTSFLGAEHGDRSRRHGHCRRAVHRAGFCRGAGLERRRLSRAHHRRGERAQRRRHDRRPRCWWRSCRNIGVTLPVLVRGHGRRDPGRGLCDLAHHAEGRVRGGGQSVIAMARSAMRSRAVSFSLALLSWPQAARMSRPRGVRTGEA